MKMMASAARAWLTQASDESRDYGSRRALEVAGRLLELCVERKVRPMLTQSPEGLLLVVPPRPYPPGTEFSMQRISIAHGPIVVECEPSCETWDRGVELVKRAQKASVTAPSWAGSITDMLRPHCEVTL